MTTFVHIDRVNGPSDLRWQYYEITMKDTLGFKTGFDSVTQKPATNRVSSFGHVVGQHNDKDNYTQMIILGIKAIFT